MSPSIERVEKSVFSIDKFLSPGQALFGSRLAGKLGSPGPFWLLTPRVFSCSELGSVERTIIARYLRLVPVLQLLAQHPAAQSLERLLRKRLGSASGT